MAPVRILTTPTRDQPETGTASPQHTGDYIGDETIRMHDVRLKTPNQPFQPQIDRNAGRAQQYWPAQIGMLDSGLAQTRLIIGRCFQAAYEGTNRRRQAAGESDQVVLHPTDSASPDQVEDADLFVVNNRGGHESRGWGIQR